MNLDRPSILLFGAIVALAVLAIGTDRLQDARSETADPGPPPFSSSLIPDSAAATPACPPALDEAVAANGLRLIGIERAERDGMGTLPRAVADQLEREYDEPVRIWCLGTLSTTADDPEAWPDGPVYVATAGPRPVHLLLVTATSDGQLLGGVAGDSISAWINAQPR